MKIHPFSDIHNEFTVWEPPSLDGEIVILAGDIDTKRRAPQWAAKSFPDKHVVLIGGNHESYGGSLFADIAAARDLCTKLHPKMHYLEREEVIVGDVRVLGCTLWTDFALYGNRAHAKAAAERGMNDYHVIKVRDKSSGENRALDPTDTERIHALSIAWLEETLGKPFDGRTIIVTHHSPSPKSIPVEFAESRLNPSYASDLTWLIEKFEPALWVHGHTHTSFDYMVGKTRIVCNPRGYVPYQPNPDFDPRLTVEV